MTDAAEVQNLLSKTNDLDMKKSRNGHSKGQKQRISEKENRISEGEREKGGERERDSHLKFL